MKERNTEMKTMTELAREYRLPNPTTEEDLELRWNTVLRYGNRILLAGYYYSPDGKSWIAAVYEFLDDSKTTCEDPIGIREISPDRFEDAGHAIAWCIQHA